MFLFTTLFPTCEESHFSFSVLRIYWVVQYGVGSVCSLHFLLVLNYPNLVIYLSVDINNDIFYVNYKGNESFDVKFFVDTVLLHINDNILYIYIYWYVVYSA